MKKAKLDQQAGHGNWQESVSSSRKQTELWNELFSNDARLNRSYDCPSQIRFEGSELERELFRYLSTVVPSLLQETNNGGVLRYMTDDEKFDRIICKPLERFICNEDDALSTLKEFSNPNKYCGKVFELGEPTYTCKDCATDPTCVLCHDCFFNSSHQTHNYKLHASHGTGGYCDCGDEEAWSTHPACEKHKDGMDVDESHDPLKNLPEEIKRKATFIVAFLIEYCVDMICWEGNDTLPITLGASTDLDNEHSKYIVMLFNDESHTYEEVKDTLKRAVPNCTSKQALHFATIVDKMGRSAIVAGDRTFCQGVVKICDMLTSSNGNKQPLKCQFIHSKVVAHQLVAQSLMAWLVTLVQASDGIRRIVTIVATKRLDSRPQSIVEQVILLDAQLWKSARFHMHQLFMNSILMDTYGRQEIAIVFAKNYKRIMSDFINDDHDHSVSVAALSVQIFTVPTIAAMLMEEHDVLLNCFTTFWDEIKLAVSASGTINFQHNLVDIKRIDFILRDIGYLLRHKAKWTDKMKTKFIDAFPEILKLLCAMQGMDSSLRETKSHVAYEPNWENGVNLQIVFVPVIEMLLAWVNCNQDIYEKVMDMSLSALKIMYSGLKFIDYKGSLVSNYDVSKSRVSVHAPLSRFIAGLVPSIIHFPSLRIDKVLQMQQEKHLPIDELHRLQVTLLEAPLRTLVLVAQVYSQMWKRNGYSLVHQVFYYQNVRFGNESYDRDILLLQSMGAIMEPNHFLDVLIHKHKLDEFFSDMSSSTPEGDENDGKSAMVSHEFFHLLYLILGERYVTNVSNVTLKDILRREVCHRLGLGSATRSSLVKNLPLKDVDDDDEFPFEAHLDEVLKEVATFRNPGIEGKGSYQLKKDKITGVHQFFIHYARNERAKLVEQKMKHLKQYPDVTAFGLDDLPAWTTTFHGILRLFECDRMEYLLRCVLRYPEHFHSEETVEVVLLIIGIGLLEVRRNNLPNFLEILRKPIEEGKNIKNLLDEMITKSPNGYSGILMWLKKLRDELMPDENKVGGVDEEHQQNKKEERERKKQIALEHRQKMMAKMGNMQKAFMKSHKGFFAQDVDMTDGEDVIDSKPSNFPVAIGANCTTIDASSYPATVQCILCQEEENIENDANLFVMTCFQQKSSVYSPENSTNKNFVSPEMNALTMTHVSSCGHILHSECWSKYYAMVKEKLTPTLMPRYRSCIDISQSEYLCPLCNSLCNTVLPLLPKLEAEISQDGQEIDLTEFLSYLERFNAELSSVAPKKEEKEDKRHRGHNRLVSFGIRFLQRYVGSRDDDDAENVMEMFAKKIEQLNSLDERYESIPLTWLSFSYTMQALECVYRELKSNACEEGTNMFNEVSDREMMFLYSYVQFLSSSSLVGVYEPLQNYGTEIFDFFCGEKCSISITTTDIFGLMVSLKFLFSAVGNIFQEKTPNFLKIPPCLLNGVILKICFVAYYVKVLVTTPQAQFNDEEMEEGSVDETEDCEYLVESLKYINTLTGNSSNISGWSQRRIKKRIVESLLPFLRCSTMFFHFLTGVGIPDELKTKTLDESNELIYMLKYLNLPTNLKELLSVDLMVKNDPIVSRMVERWCRVIPRPPSFDRCYLYSRRLIDLPDQYSILIKKSSGFKCPMVGDTSRSPSLCLICGEIVCSQCYCCATETANFKRLGASAAHTEQCGYGLGVFLRIRDSEVYFLYNQRKGIFMAAPYLDKYGEPDRDLRRGNPLFLDKTQYERLQSYWLQHKIPTMIAQAMENKRNFLTYDWSMI